MTLFPLVEVPTELSQQASKTLPLYREISWDFTADRPLWRGGSPVWATGKEAVTTWIWNTLKTARQEVDIFDPDWGNEIQVLTGRPFSQSVKESEATRYVKEALAVNPYITDVRQVSVDFSGSRLRVSVAIDTIYGEVTFDGAEL